MSRCPVCECAVYKVEEIFALGRIWHKACFKCGAFGKSGGCHRSLQPGQFLDHEQEPFCTACYEKLYKPKGFGFGNSLTSTEIPSTIESLHKPDVETPLKSPQSSSNPSIHSSTSPTKPSISTTIKTSTEAKLPDKSDAPKPPLQSSNSRRNISGSLGLVAMLQSQNRTIDTGTNKKDDYIPFIDKHTVANNQENTLSSSVTKSFSSSIVPIQKVSSPSKVSSTGENTISKNPSGTYEDNVNQEAIVITSNTTTTTSNTINESAPSTSTSSLATPTTPISKKLPQSTSSSAIESPTVGLNSNENNHIKSPPSALSTSTTHAIPNIIPPKLNQSHSFKSSTNATPTSTPTPPNKIFTEKKSVTNTTLSSIATNTAATSSNLSVPSTASPPPPPPIVTLVKPISATKDPHPSATYVGDGDEVDESEW